MNIWHFPEFTRRLAFPVIGLLGLFSGSCSSGIFGSGGVFDSSLYKPGPTGPQETVLDTRTLGNAPQTATVQSTSSSGRTSVLNRSGLKFRAHAPAAGTDSAKNQQGYMAVEIQLDGETDSARLELEQKNARSTKIDRETGEYFIEYSRDQVGMLHSSLGVSVLYMVDFKNGIRNTETGELFRYKSGRDKPGASRFIGASFTGATGSAPLGNSLLTFSGKARSLQVREAGAEEVTVAQNGTANLTINPANLTLAGRLRFADHDMKLSGALDSNNFIRGGAENRMVSTGSDAPLSQNSTNSLNGIVATGNEQRAVFGAVYINETDVTVGGNAFDSINGAVIFNGGQ